MPVQHHTQYHLHTQARRSEVSFTKFELKMLDIYFYWSVFNVFVGSLLSGTIVAQINLIINKPSMLMIVTVVVMMIVMVLHA